MSRLSILQQIFPLTFCDGWKRERIAQHQHSSEFQLCITHRISKWSVYSELRIHRIWWTTGGSLKAAGCTASLSYQLFGMTAWFQSVTGCLSFTKSIHSRIPTALKPSTAYLVQEVSGQSNRSNVKVIQPLIKRRK